MLAFAALALGAVVASAAPITRGDGSRAVSPASAAATRVTVAPRTGNASTRFAVRFRNPYRTGRRGGVQTWEVASVSDRAATGRCTSQMSLQLAPAGAGRTMRFRLAPTRSWCTGRYSGTITLYRNFGCQGPPRAISTVSPTARPVVVACPETVPAPVLVGRFSFKVARATA